MKRLVWIALMATAAVTASARKTAVITSHFFHEGFNCEVYVVQTELAEFEIIDGTTAIVDGQVVECVDWLCIDEDYGDASVWRIENSAYGTYYEISTAKCAIERTTLSYDPERQIHIDWTDTDSKPVPTTTFAREKEDPSCHHCMSLAMVMTVEALTPEGEVRSRTIYTPVPDYTIVDEHTAIIDGQEVKFEYIQPSDLDYSKKFLFLESYEGPTSHSSRYIYTTYDLLQMWEIEIGHDANHRVIIEWRDTENK